MEEEVWKELPGYPDYMVSNLGRVKSLKFGKERILKPRLTTRYYHHVHLRLNRLGKDIGVHQLVAMGFLGHKPCGHKVVVDHIDHNPLNNNVENLRLVSNRENVQHRKKKGSSAYPGVSWNTQKAKWRAAIYIEKKTKLLGYFTDELEAANAYQTALEAHKNKMNEN